MNTVLKLNRYETVSLYPKNWPFPETCARLGINLDGPEPEPFTLLSIRKPDRLPLLAILAISAIACLLLAFFVVIMVAIANRPGL